MICLKCEGDTQVVDTGSSSDEIVRRRKCKKCGYQFYTVERVADMKYPQALLAEYKTKKGITKCITKT